MPAIDRCERFGIGQIEAIACSKLVVSTDLPTGVRSINQHGTTGLIAPPGEPEALAGTLNLLLSNPSLRAKFGEVACRRIEQEFRAGRMMSKH